MGRKIRGRGWKTLLFGGSVDGRAIDVRKGEKRQESIPRVALRTDKLIVCNVRQAVFLTLVVCLLL